MLYLDYTSLIFRENPSSGPAKAAFEELVDKIKTTGKVHTTLMVGVGVSIRTNDLEGLLKEFALRIGIRIVYEQVTSIKALLDKEPGVNVLVGSDGSHSIVRKEVFEDKKKEECLQYAVELKCELNSS